MMTVTVEGAAEAASDEVMADVALAIIENNRLLRRIYRMVIVGLAMLALGLAAGLVAVVVMIREFGL